jgi:hypothetical protein
LPRNPTGFAKNFSESFKLYPFGVRITLKPRITHRFTSHQQVIPKMYSHRSAVRY